MRVFYTHYRRLPLTPVASDPTSPVEEVALLFNVSPCLIYKAGTWLLMTAFYQAE